MMMMMMISATNKLLWLMKLYNRAHLHCVDNRWQFASIKSQSQLATRTRGLWAETAAGRRTNNSEVARTSASQQHSAGPSYII